jgi:hypothetical protein
VNRKDRRSWDQMVHEHREKFAEVAMPDGDPIKIYIPDAEKLTAFYTTRQRGTLDEALSVLMGEDNTARLQDAAKVAAGSDGRVPVTVWRELLEQVMEDLGMGGTSPER